MGKFLRIETIDDVRPFVADRPEIKFLSQPNGTTVACYVFADGHTFNHPVALECRGLCFGRDGRVCSRPLHKFFNVGEKEWLRPEMVLSRPDVSRVMEKIDGSMISTAWVDGCLEWRSKKSFTSDVVRLATEFLRRPENRFITAWAREVAANGMTATFELTHPEARIVCDRPADLTLLAIRDNLTGEYIPTEIAPIPKVRRFDLTAQAAADTLAEMKGAEGYVIQFADGDMVKMKCPWYIRLHKSVSMLRERDIAELAIREELDDTKAALVECGIDLREVEEVEARVKAEVLAVSDVVEAIMATDAGMVRKDFAIKHRENPVFSLLMRRFAGQDVSMTEWFVKNRLPTYSLRSLAGAAALDDTPPQPAKGGEEKA
jgi:RNA ligase